MKRHFFSAIILLLSCCHVFGQISTDEEPVSFRMNIPVLQRSAKAQKVLPALDMQMLEKSAHSLRIQQGCNRKEAVNSFDVKPK